MISVAKMKETEKKALEMGVMESVLMENAGANAARIVKEKKGLRGKKVLIFCGTGNNAGDGLVFGRHALIYGASVSVYFVKNPEILRTDTARRNYAVLSELKPIGFKVKFYIEKPPRGNFDILVDALIGTGIKRDVSEEYTKAIKKFNEMSGFKVSLDCPSGINCDTGEVMGTAVKPDLTITFHDTKKGLDRGNSGKIVVADIGIPKI